MNMGVLGLSTFSSKPKSITKQQGSTDPSDKDTSVERAAGQRIAKSSPRKRVLQ